MLGPFSPRTDIWLPVRLISDADFRTELIGVTYDMVTVHYQRGAGAVWEEATITSDDWKEWGRGDYRVRIGRVEFTAIGLWAYRVSCSGSLNYVEDVVIRESTAGQGAYTVTLTLESTGGAPVPYCPVTVRNSTEEVAIAHGVSDSEGVVEFNLDAATYKLRPGPRPGYDFTNWTDGTTTGLPFTLTVTDAVSKTLTCAKHDQYYEGFTYGELKRAVGRVLSRDYNKTIGEEDLADWVKAGYSAVNGAIRWCRSLYSTVSVDGQASYTLWQPCKEIMAVTYDASPLISVTHPQYLQMLDDDDSEGTPTHYSRFGSDLYLYPTPDTSGEALHVWMLVAPPLLESDDDVPEFPAEYHRGIVDYALSVAFRDLGLDDRSMAYLNAFQAQMQLAPQPVIDQGQSAVEILPE